MIVYIKTHTVGQHFGTSSALYQVGTHKRVAEVERVYPYGFTSSAYAAAETLAARNGWTVVETGGAR